jgi:hypothetical protein
LHAQGFLACDFCLAITAGSRVLYVFVVIEHGTRRLVHCNVTAHPTAAWTRQQLREVVGIDHRYRFLLHDHDSIFSGDLDSSTHALWIEVLRSIAHGEMVCSGPSLSAEAGPRGALTQYRISQRNAARETSPHRMTTMRYQLMGLKYQLMRQPTAVG